MSEVASRVGRLRGGMNEDSSVYLYSDDMRFTHAMSREEAQAQSPCVPSRESILVTVYFLVGMKELPVDIANHVLDFAGLSLMFETETNRLERGSSNMNVEYLALAIPSAEELMLPKGLGVGRCLQMLVDLESHDQGWASDAPEHNRTYHACWSWSELEVKAPGDTEPLRVEVGPNLRAHRSYRLHRRIFSPTSDIDAPVLEHIVPGSQLRLFLRSQFPGWINNAKYARMVVTFAFDFDEEMDAQAITRSLRTLHQSSKPLESQDSAAGKSTKQGEKECLIQ